MSYLGKMLSKTYLLKINDVHVLALLKEMREEGADRAQGALGRHHRDGGVHGGRVLISQAGRGEGLWVCGRRAYISWRALLYTLTRLLSFSRTVRHSS